MSEAIRFLMDGEIHTLRDVDPTMTVLDWLRYEAARTGTKEGCAEGDCGACTVVLGTLSANGETIETRAVNACILFLPVLDGKELITVESLKDRESGALHPAQQAMVETHGSQCGFCTPGFVMSLYALDRQVKAGTGDTSLNTVNDCLAGNLCRCTGYGPIIEAAGRLGGGPDHLDRAEQARIARLKQIRRDDTLHLTWHDPVAGRERQYFAPVTIESLAELVDAHPDATLLAGGTDVGLWVTKQHRTLDTVIHTGNVTALNHMHENADGFTIGAAVTYTAAMDRLGAAFPDLGELFRRLGSTQIRNSGTIGGNIANGSPIGDSMPALIALGATLHLRKGADCRSLPLEDYFIDYGKQDLREGEFVEAVSVPRLADGAWFYCHKISKRFDQDISAVMLGLWLDLDGDTVRDARLCYGGMAATPKRARTAETALTGRAFDEAAVADAVAALAADFTPLSDMRASSTYRMRVAGNLIRRAWAEREDGPKATRLVGHGAEVAHA
ncbi:xanthine dehydrogenase small subunit [Yunchengibacter salinarum]|uniref:xanthine dehydrogenase small subunit n=1 Tax=Yunchengibacter salinarum TaxID=3133399 RepID=UPI0035B5B4C9